MRPTEKTVVVVKHGNGCRVLINPEPAAYLGKEHAINPNLDNVIGTSPEFWSLTGSAPAHKVSSTVAPLASATSYKNADGVIKAIKRNSENSEHMRVQLQMRLDEIKRSLSDISVTVKKDIEKESRKVMAVCLAFALVCSLTVFLIITAL